MIPVSSRRMTYRVRVTMDLLECPQAENPATLPPFVHGVALKTFAEALREAGLEPDMERTTVVFQGVPDPQESAVGHKTYAWTFTFPVPYHFTFTTPGEHHE